MADDKASHYQGVLWAVHTLEYPYTRSVGPVIGTFLAGLKEGRVVGTRTAAGKVIVPPSEFDPQTGATLTEFRDVSDTGAVTTWTWVTQPRGKHPLKKPFAWALIKLDGADTAMLHAIDAGDPAKMKAGLRVKAKWREQRTGSINDIECFVPVEG
jgi:uncharacterized OB-fold protein